jgi:hypothetical protein
VVTRQVGITPGFAAMVNGHITSINQSVAGLCRDLYESYQAGHQVTLELQKSQAQYKELADRQERLEETRLAEMEKSATTIKELRDIIRAKDEQIDGKRSLWIDYNPRSARRLQDPYVTPTGQRTPGIGIALNESSGGPANLQARFEQLQVRGENTNVAGPSSSRSIEQSHVPQSSMDGASNLSVVGGESMALVPFKTEQQVAGEFRDQFNALYALGEGWVNTYAHIVPSQQHDQALSHNSNLWTSMLRVTYQTFEQAQPHVIALLRDPFTRPLFILRLLVQYIDNELWKATIFLGSDPTLDHQLRGVIDRLATRGKLGSLYSSFHMLLTKLLQAYPPWNGISL